MPLVRTDGRSVGWSVYGHVITKFSRMGRLPRFLSYGAPPTRGAWSSAITINNIIIINIIINFVSNFYHPLTFLYFASVFSYFSFGDISVNPFYLKFGGKCSFHGGVVCVRAARSRDARSEGDSPGWKMRDCSWVNKLYITSSKANNVTGLMYILRIESGNRVSFFPSILYIDWAFLPSLFVHSPYNYKVGYFYKKGVL